MRNSFVVSAILRLALNLLIGCFSSGKGGSVSATPTTSFETVSWAKLWNSAFASEFDGKRVRLEAMFLGVAQSQMDVSAAFKPYNSGD